MQGPWSTVLLYSSAQRHMAGTCQHPTKHVGCRKHDFKACMAQRHELVCCRYQLPVFAGGSAVLSLLLAAAKAVLWQ
jgi:hypothetical protein